MRFALAAWSDDVVESAKALSLLTLPVSSIAPVLDHAFRNGFRFDVVIPKDPLGKVATKGVVVAEWKGSLRIFKVDFTSLK